MINMKKKDRRFKIKKKTTNTTTPQLHKHTHPNQKQKHKIKRLELRKLTWDVFGEKREVGLWEKWVLGVWRETRNGGKLKHLKYKIV